MSDESTGPLSDPGSDRMSMREFARRYDLPDWRILLRRIEATFRGADFATGAELVARIAAAAEEVGHHPDLDLRYPGRVHVVLTSHGAGGLTDADAALAARVSELAASLGATSDPQAAADLEIGIDALDIPAVLPFWAAVMGYDAGEDGMDNDAVLDPARIHPAIWFQQMDEPRPQRNRVHLDLTVPADVAEARIAAAVAGGGRVLSTAEAPSFTVLADPEGNEVCICTYLERD